jgi:hypothetical protein
MQEMMYEQQAEIDRQKAERMIPKDLMNRESNIWTPQAIQNSYQQDQTRQQQIAQGIVTQKPSSQESQVPDQYKTKLMEQPIQSMVNKAESPPTAAVFAQRAEDYSKSGDLLRSGSYGVAAVGIQAGNTIFGTVKTTITEPWQIVNPLSYKQSAEQLATQVKTEPTLFGGSILGIYGGSKAIGTIGEKATPLVNQFRKTELTGKGSLTTKQITIEEQFANTGKSEGLNNPILGKTKDMFNIKQTGKITTDIPDTFSFKVKGIKEGKPFEMLTTQKVGTNEIVTITGKQGRYDFIGEIRPKVSQSKAISRMEAPAPTKVVPMEIKMTVSKTTIFGNKKVVSDTVKPYNPEPFTPEKVSEISMNQEAATGSRSYINLQKGKLETLNAQREGVINYFIKSKEEMIAHNKSFQKAELQSKPTVTEVTEVYKAYNEQPKITMKRQSNILGEQPTTEGKILEWTKPKSVSVKETPIEFADVRSSPQDVTLKKPQGSYMFDGKPISKVEITTQRGGELKSTTTNKLFQTVEYKYGTKFSAEQLSKDIKKLAKGKKGSSLSGQESIFEKAKIQTKNPISENIKFPKTNMDNIFGLTENINIGSKMKSYSGIGILSVSVSQGSKSKLNQNQNNIFDTQSKQNQNNILDNKYKQDQNNKIEQMFKPIEVQKSNIIQQQKPIIETKQQQRIEQTQRQITETPQKQITRQTQTQVPRVTPKIPTPQVPKVPTPIIPINIFGLPNTTRPINQKVTGYNVYMKERKKVVKANKQPLPLDQAQSLGYDIGDNSLSASFKLSKTKQQVPAARRAKFAVGTFNKSNFSQNKKGWFVEKRSKRLDTPNEVKGIQASKLIAQTRKKNIFGL